MNITRKAHLALTLILWGIIVLLSKILADYSRWSREDRERIAALRSMVDSYRANR